MTENKNTTTTQGTPIAKIEPKKLAVPKDMRFGSGVVPKDEQALEKSQQSQQLFDKAQKAIADKKQAHLDEISKIYDTNEKEFMGDIDSVWNDTGSKKHKLVTIMILGLLLTFIAWSSWATVDELTRGQGQVIASSRTQVITHLEGGILTGVLVTEGVIVEEGQTLAQVENVAAASTYEDAQQKIYEHTTAILRLQAELEGKELVYGQTYVDAVPELVQLQYQTDTSRKLKFKTELSVLESQEDQIAFELSEMEKRLETTKQTYQLSARRLDLARPVFARGLYSELDFLNLEQEVVRLSGEVKSLENSIDKTKSAIEEAQYNQELYKSTYNQEIIDEINKRTSERSSLEKTLTAGSDRVDRTEIRSPMRGVVNKIILNTRGSAVKPGEPIMEVVPLDDTLLIEAKIKPSDIGFIYPNQTAVVKLTAYDFSIFGGLEAFVEQISADTTEGKNQEYYYLVKLRTQKNALEYKGEALPIIPGMVASVDIITGKKTIMQYLLKPILKAKDNALRER